MSIAKDLKLLSLLYRAPVEQVNEILTGSGCVALRAVLEERGLLELLAAPKEDLYKAITVILERYRDQVTEYREEDLWVNEGLNNFILEIIAVVDNTTDPKLPSLDVIARGIIGQGKADDQYSRHNAVDMLLDVFDKFINWGLETVGPEQVQSPYPITRLAEVIVFMDDVLSMLSTYLTCKDNPDCSEIDLLNERNDMDEELLLNIPEDAYGNVEEQMEHITTMVEGAESFLLGDGSNLSRAQEYLHGVLYAQSEVPQLRDGNEGKIMDSIKKAATKVWETLMSALKAIKDFFFGKADQETQQATLAIADKNKAALAANENKSAPINDAAKTGLIELADKSDESGAFKSAAEGLQTLGDAPGVLEKLKGLMNKQVSSGGNLRKLYEAAEKKVQDLKALMTKADSVNDDDKEGAAAAKQELQEGMTEAKEALNEAKKEMSLHKKFMNGLRKAMLNITAGIFLMKDAKDMKATA